MNKYLIWALALLAVLLLVIFYGGKPA